MKKLICCCLFLFSCILLYIYPVNFDITYLKNNTLSDVSKNLISHLDKPLLLELMTTDLNIASQVKTTVSLFQKENSKILLNIQNTALTPGEKRAFHLRSNHTLILTYGENKKLFDLDMPQLTEPLLANFIYQVLRNQEAWVVFLTGHGEPNPTGTENRHLSQLTTHLKKQGLNIAAINSQETGGIPDNAKILVIADTQQPLLPKEMQTILDFIHKGGNLLWLVNPDSAHIKGFGELAEKLGVSWPSGTLLDHKAHSMGTPDPAISVITQYTQHPHPITQSLEYLTVFPWATPLDYHLAAEKGFEAKPFLVTHPSVILKTKEVQAKKTGPFTLAVSLEKGKQRVIIMGNSHFLSNSTVHNYGNLTLASNIFNWLSETDILLGSGSKETEHKKAIDLAFVDSPFLYQLRQVFFPFILPLVFLSIAWNIKRTRQNRSNRWILQHSQSKL